MRAFDQVLEPYPTDSVLRAFRDWMKTEKTMPTPADILAILDWDPIPQSPETKAFNRKIAEQSERAERYKDLTPEQKAKFDQLMASIQKTGESAKVSQGPGNLDYSHWDSMPDEAKEICRQNLIQSYKRLKEAQ